MEAGAFGKKKTPQGCEAVYLRACMLSGDFTDQSDKRN